MELTLLSKTELTVEVGVKGSVVSKKYASAIAKASLMSKCVVVDIKEPDSEASADFSDTEIGVAQKKKAIYDAEDEPRPALNPHIQDIQLVH
ncbi:unnamed protein product, partial [Brassica rapa subsp. trilocularis]